MLFNSLEFLLFLPAVFSLYWFLFSARVKSQNLLIVVASFVFYGWWNWKFTLLLAAEIVVSFVLGLAMAKSKKPSHRNFYFGLNLLVLIGLLCFFKYFNFFMQSWADAWGAVGVHFTALSIQVVLPLGISFFTFQSLSYAIDIYKGYIEPTKDFISYSAFVSFFPQLVSGPIARAEGLLPQMLEKREFSYDRAMSGLRAITIGLFKKVVVADTLAPLVDDIFNNSSTYGSLSLVIGSVLFTFQIYADFSGYSDMAVGIGRLFGIELIENFRFPYFSKSIPEFWSRWHRSLSTWFNDYIFFPLAFRYRNLGRFGVILAVCITFLVSGLWHGASYNYVIWGVCYAVLYIPYILAGSSLLQNSDDSGDETSAPFFRRIRSLLLMLFIFGLNVFVFTVFKASTLSQSAIFISRALHFHGTEFDFIKTNTHLLLLLKGLLGIAVLMVTDYMLFANKMRKAGLQSSSHRPFAFLTQEPDRFHLF